MAKQVKTLFMDAVETAIRGMVSIKQVKRGQTIPIDEETASYPWACFFDEPEVKSSKNRVAFKEFDLIVHVWVKEKKDVTLDEQLDIMDADLDKVLLINQNVLDASFRIEPVSAEKFYIDDEIRAIGQTVYHVVCCHKWKDPYDPSKGS